MHDATRARIPAHPAMQANVSASKPASVCERAAAQVWRFILEREVEAPERFQAIQSYRATMAVLRHQANFVKQLFDTGVVDELERDELLGCGPSSLAAPFFIKHVYSLQPGRARKNRETPQSRRNGCGRQPRQGACRLSKAQAGEPSLQWGQCGQWLGTATTAR